MKIISELDRKNQTTIYFVVNFQGIKLEGPFKSSLDALAWVNRMVQEKGW